MGNNGLIVRRIEDGVVIDHMDSGTAEILLPYLVGNSRSDSFRVVLENAPSQNHGRKDVIKLDGRGDLTPQELALLWLLSGRSTVNIIVGGVVKRKYDPQIPTEVVGVLSCPHPGCITRDPSEHAITRFYVDGTGTILTCAYCDLSVPYTEATQYLIDPDDMR